MTAPTILELGARAWAGSWTVDPALAWCALAAGAYLLGRRRLAARRPRSRLVRGPGTAAFLSGVGLVAVAIASPLDRAADELFSLHMVQHLVLALVAPLLVVASRPAAVLRWSLPPALGREVTRRIRSVTRRIGLRRVTTGAALCVIVAHVGALAVWHVPVAYDAALTHPVLHGLEHLSMFATGIGLWWVVLATGRRRQRGLGVVYLFLAGLPMGAVAALLTLAPRALYTAHLTTTAAWGLTPLEDQQLAGAIMWVPGGAIYLIAASVLFVGWLAAGPIPGREQVLTWDG